MLASKFSPIQIQTTVPTALRMSRCTSDLADVFSVPDE